MYEHVPNKVLESRGTNVTQTLTSGWCNRVRFRWTSYNDGCKFGCHLCHSIVFTQNVHVYRYMYILYEHTYSSPHIHTHSLILVY